MADIDATESSRILPGDALKMVHGLNRRDFLKASLGSAAFLYLDALNTGCGGNTQAPDYPISSTVAKTVQRTLSFPMPAKVTTPNSGTGLCPTELPLVSQYSQYGYGTYTYGGALPIVQRYDIMPAGYSNSAPLRVKRLANFFAMTDVHITDKEAPNQLIYLQQADVTYGGPQTSIYSPVMPYTTHVLDAAIQTVNALHTQNPFDFGISLGDICNSAQYNELRWYIDVIDGKVIAPSSGAHLGANTVDYQRPFKAAGLNPSIPWYQVLGNHDHFLIGSIPINADSTLNLSQSYTSGNVWAIGDLIRPNSPSSTFPCLFDMTASLKQQTLYGGVIDGSTPTGTIAGAGAVGSIPQPVVAADPNRRALLRTEWIQEFFNTTTSPAGHGLNLVDPSMGSGFACYSFIPKANIPLKIIVLDDTQSDNDGSHDIHGHGFLDATRWNWLQAQLAAGQAANQLMIIAAHVPIAVANIGSELEWWEPANDPNAKVQNAVTLTGLVAVLQNTPNLLMWMAGHRHFNTVKAFLPPSGGGPEKGFWQVETSSLRDFPQQLRTFEIYLNSDYTVSIVTTNVDPAVADGSPAAKSRSYSIATQQIAQTNLLMNSQNLQKAYGAITVNTMDPTRLQNGLYSDPTTGLDPTILYGAAPGVPYCASYNAELFKQLSPTMTSVLQAQFPAPA